MTLSGAPETAQQACDRCGTFATDFILVGGQSYCAACAERVLAESRSPPSKGWIVAAIVFGGLPVPLWLVLNFLRPDLIAPMLDHLFGYVITVTELMLTVLGVATYLVLVTVGPGSRGLRVVLTVIAAFLFTLPALLLVMFAPIVSAFMFGGAPTQ